MREKTVEMPAELRELVSLNAAAVVARLDFDRAVQAAERAGYSVATIGRALRMPHDQIREALAATPAEPGFSGAGPYEICQRYAVGQIDREQLVDELARWQYTPMPETDPWDDIVLSPGPGSWHEVVDARRDGLIDWETYGEALNRREPRADSRPAEAAHAAPGPYELCQRYAAGEIDRDQLIDELARWEYTEIPKPTWLDDIAPGPGPGSFREVMRAADEELIDDAIYDEVQRRRNPRDA